jgi:predicted Zn-dependent protease
MLAAVLIGVAAGGNGDAVQGAVAVSQGVAAKQRLNYSRANEAEADRVGMSVLASAGYDPNGMATFFETLGRQTTLGASRIPEFLLTHPVTTNRIAEAKDRAQQYSTVRPVDSTGYQLARERVRVLSTSDGRDAREPYADAVAGADVPLPAARRYGRAIAATAAGDPAEAIAALRELRTAHPEVIPYHTALAEAYLKAGETTAARGTLSEAMTLFPRNVAVTVLYGDTLLRNNEPAEAHRVLLDLFNNVPATPLQIRLLAQAASAQGDTPEANYYAAEYLLAVGDLNRAINQLNRALATAGVSEVQTARFTARREELKEFLPPKLQGYVDRGEPLPEPEYGDARGR